MLQRNDYDFRNQRKILVLEMFEIPGAQTLTKILLHSVIRTTVIGRAGRPIFYWLPGSVGQPITSKTLIQIVMMRI